MKHLNYFTQVKILALYLGCEIMVPDNRKKDVAGKDLLFTDGTDNVVNNINFLSFIEKEMVKKGMTFVELGYRMLLSNPFELLVADAVIMQEFVKFVYPGFDERNDPMYLRHVGVRDILRHTEIHESIFIIEYDSNNYCRIEIDTENLEVCLQKNRIIDDLRLNSLDGADDKLYRDMDVIPDNQALIPAFFIGKYSAVPLLIDNKDIHPFTDGLAIQKEVIKKALPYN